MALKDWKKAGDDYWERKSIKGNMFRGKIGTDRLGITKAYSEKTEEYTDYAVTTMTSGGGVTSKQFKTKPLALSFARKYMRSH